MTTDNASELGIAIDRNENEIIVEGDLAKKVIRIRATGKVAWVIAGGCIVAAIVAILAMPAAPATGPVGIVAESIALGAGGAGAVAVLGASTTVTAISIGVGAKSKAVLTKLRENYNLTKLSENRILLKRK